MIPDASEKIRAAAALLGPERSTGHVKSIHGYIEGDLLRHVPTEQRQHVIACLVALRAEMSPGAPTWSPDVPAVKAKLLKIADDIALTERLSLTRAELASRIKLACEAARQEALDSCAALIEQKGEEAFKHGFEQGRASVLVEGGARPMNVNSKRNGKQQETVNG